MVPNKKPDGSNWELLCPYCHDNEHSRYLEADRGAGLLAGAVKSATHSPFVALAGMIKKNKWISDVFLADVFPLRPG